MFLQVTAFEAGPELVCARVCAASKGDGRVDVRSLGQNRILDRAQADVAAQRELNRRRRLRRVMFWLSFPAIWLWARLLSGDPVSPGWPSFPEGAELWLPAVILAVMIGVLIIGQTFGLGRSPHTVFRSSELDVTLADVRGMGEVLEEVVRTMNLFLGHRTFAERMGGTARRAVLFEGPPGTGKTYAAKAMAREAGVPFLYVSATSFQSPYLGASARKIRRFFRTLRKIAREEGGAIGFIEEFDAIGMSRSGVSSRMSSQSMQSSSLPGLSGTSSGALPNMGRTMDKDEPGSVGVASFVNELLVQLQSFDEPPFNAKVLGWFIDRVNRWLPDEKQLRKPGAVAANILVIGATNRAADLDSALLRPGRFDKVIHFGAPGRAGRREIIDYYLEKKNHTSELDDGAYRDTLAAITQHYTPAMLEHILDEALVCALRDGREFMTWSDVTTAKLTEEAGLRSPKEMTPEERFLVATHEAGHATIAYVAGKTRKLELLSIIARQDSLGMLMHTDVDEKFNSSREELYARILIAFGGMCSEERYFVQAGTGTAGDLQTATETAAAMVGAYGMSDTLISYMPMDSGPIKTGLVAHVLQDEQGRAMVESLLEKAKAEAARVVVTHAHVLEALRDALLEREELVGQDILDVIEEAEKMVLDISKEVAAHACD